MKRFNSIFSIVVLLATALFLTGCPRTSPGPNRPPIARVGPDQEVELNGLVALDGRDSFDPDDDPITYEWNLLYRPTGGHALLENEHDSMCLLRPDVPGVWIVSLKVSDGEYVSEPDVVQVRVKAGAGLDLDAREISASGVYDNKYLDSFNLYLLNSGIPYTGPVTFTAWGMDKWTGGKLGFARTFTIDDIKMDAGAGMWLPLLKREIEWPEDVCYATLGVIVDPNNAIDETVEGNNSRDDVFYRDDLTGNCSSENVLSGKIAIISQGGAGHLWYVHEGDLFVFPSTEPFVFVLDFRNCCPENTFELSIVYDWSPDPENGLNVKLVDKSKIALTPGEENAIRFDGIAIPRLEEFEQSDTTLAIIAYYEEGYELLFKTPVRAEYWEIIGK